MNDHSQFRYASLVPGETTFPFVRWGMTAAMLLLAAGVVGLGALAERWPTARLAVGAALAVGVTVLVSAAWRGDSTRVGPDWSDAVRQAQASCGVGGTARGGVAAVSKTAEVPAGWTVRLPCAEL